MWRNALIAVAVAAVPAALSPLSLGPLALAAGAAPGRAAAVSGRSTEGLVAVATVHVAPADDGCRDRSVPDVLGAAALVGPEVLAAVLGNGCGDQPPNRR